MLILFIAVYLGITLLIGFWAANRVRSSGDYMLAGKSLPMLLSTSALFATWFGSETVFGASSQFLEGGLYHVIEDPFGAALCLLLFGFLFARKLYKMNLLTLGDYFKVRFGRKTEVVASVFMVPSYFGYIAGQLVAMGLVMNIITSMPVWVGVVISAVIVMIYTFFGGMWAVSVTDFVQSVIIVSGLVVLAVVLSQKAGGFAHVIETAPAETFRFLPRANGSEILSYVAAWSVLGLGSLPSQDIFQRAMSSSSVKVAVRSCYYAAGLYLTVAMVPLFISLCVKHLYPDQLSGDTQLVLPAMVLAHTSVPVQILFFGAILSAVMSTTSSSVLAPSAIFAENIMRPLSKRPLTDTTVLRITRGCVVIFSAIASVMACMRSNIYELVGESSILSLVSLFIPLLAGLYWKGASSTGALIAMVSGMTAWMCFELVNIGVPSLLPAVVISLLGMVAGSVFRPDKKVNIK